MLLSCLIADFAALEWNIACILCSRTAPCLKAFALTGRDCSNTRYPGCRFACPGLCAPLGFQPALAKSETWDIENQWITSFVIGWRTDEVWLPIVRSWWCLARQFERVSCIKTFHKAKILVFATRIIIACVSETQMSKCNLFRPKS